MLMSYFSDTTGLYTDFYELTMAYGYFRKGRVGETAVFDYFFRTNPFQNGFTVYAGLRDLLEMLEQFTYSANDLAYLRGLGFAEDFLEYLRDFRFLGTLYSMEEGRWFSRGAADACGRQPDGDPVGGVDVAECAQF